MQTFLPWGSFDRSAQDLDRQRLGKQRVECLQIMTALALPNYGWQHHPAVRMWRGHQDHLLDYQGAICSVWRHKGYRDTCWEKTQAMFRRIQDESDMPPWLGDEALHRSHRSNLIRKDPAFYGPKYPGVPDDLEYVWPVS
jgi:hypothetical protein